MPRDKAICDVLDSQFYKTSYRDSRSKVEGRALDKALLRSNTLYIGNLSFYTREEQIWELFSRAGEVNRVIMGLHRYDKTPCGFCFVEYADREGAEMAMRYLNKTRLDDRLIRTDWDMGFMDGRQYGRGKSGGQVRDEYRKDFDAERGGYGGMYERKT